MDCPNHNDFQRLERKCLPEVQLISPRRHNGLATVILMDAVHYQPRFLILA